MTNMISRMLIPKFGIALFILALLFIGISPSLATRIYVAQGDTAFMPEQSPNGTCWIFPDNGVMLDDSLLDYPALQRGNQTYCVIDNKTTANLPAGTYNILYEAPASINGQQFKDISYNNKTYISALSYVKPFSISGMDAPTAMQRLEKLILTNHLNNVSVDQVIVEKPVLTIKSFGPISKDAYTILNRATDNAVVTTEQIYSPFYRIAGTSNLPNNTKITVQIDETRYFAQHNASYTYTTTFSRPQDQAEAAWSCDIAMDINSMPAGWHDITVTAGSLTTTTRFKVDQQAVPSPTPTQYVNYLSNGDIAPVTVTVTVIQTQFVDRWQTATPTPAITDALGNIINYPYEPGNTIPPEAGVGCLIVIAGIILMRDVKKK